MEIYADKQDTFGWRKVGKLQENLIPCLFHDIRLEKVSRREGRISDEEGTSGTSGSTTNPNLECSGASSSMECSTSTVDHAVEEIERDADEEFG